PLLSELREAFGVRRLAGAFERKIQPRLLPPRRTRSNPSITPGPRKRRPVAALQTLSRVPLLSELREAFGVRRLAGAFERKQQPQLFPPRRTRSSPSIAPG